MQKLRILIVEDELIIAESLKLQLESMDYEVVDIFTSGTETIENFKPGFADIIMMDIQLAGGTNGIDTSIEIRKISTAPIIFITNVSDERTRKKAINETNAVYYINKPFSKQDISTAIDFALKSIKREELMVRSNENSYLLKDCIFVKNGFGFKKVMIADILYLKADGSYCELKLKENTVTFSENLSFLEKKLDFASELVRVHRSYVVNIHRIQRIHENRLWVGDDEIPIGKTYKNLLDNIVRFIWC